MLHRGHILCDQVPAWCPTMVTPESGLSRHRQHFDEAVILTVGNGSIEIIDAKTVFS